VLNPVILPPGRAWLCTRPAPAGSVTTTNTIGMRRVASCAATAGRDSEDCVGEVLRAFATPAFDRRCQQSSGIRRERYGRDPTQPLKLLSERSDLGLCLRRSPPCLTARRSDAAARRTAKRLCRKGYEPRRLMYTPVPVADPHRRTLRTRITG
jgi:hypothetical protein